MDEILYQGGRIESCRISGSKNLVSVLNLGEQKLTGVFPDPSEVVDSAPLELVWCPDSGLLQLAHSFEPSKMYGDNYGYRSGLNDSMVRHLTAKIALLERMANLKPDDTVLDIGSNDATSLKAYSVQGLHRVGIDPTARKFAQYYPSSIAMVPDFFSRAVFERASPRRARIVTSVAMFYDLEDPIAFARDVAAILAPDGIWHLEQSYLPAMLRATSYDTVCHEHLEYYSLRTVQRILAAADLVVVDVQMNGVNGGSFAVTAAHASSSYRRNTAVIDWLLGQEERMGLASARPYREFEDRVYRHRDDLTRLVRTLTADGKKVLGYGASTKGNVTLQFCGFTANDIPAIADVNPEKHGRVTPGTQIPIASEAEARAMKPDYFLVLPWHFKQGILGREQAFLAGGGKLIFPFPDIEIV